MTDRKGVDSIGRGRGSDGKRGGAELRRERRRCCAKDPVRVAGVEEERRGADFADRSREPATAARN